MFTLIGKTNIDFLGWRKASFVVSLAMFAIGLWGSVRLFTGKAAMATDFDGGARVTVKLEKQVPLEQLRKALSAGGEDAEIQQVGEGAEYMLRIRKSSAAIGAMGDKAISLIKGEFKDNKVLDSSTEEVGPAVSRELKSKSLMAALVAFIGILFYVMIRFDFRFAVGAIVATLHDLFVVLGIVVLMGHEFSLLVVTALLTLAGYSLNDTVVVYDRVRENLRLHRSSPYLSVVNTALNDTLTRTINTGMTTLVVLTVLYFLGGEVTQDFCLTLLIGIVVGTYSSLFVASPLVVEWNLRSPKRG